ncbi:MAG: AAA family ATPase [Gammaproteobacteria bacterium]
MKRIVIFGNSGSGKTTLAKEYSAKYNLPHLDLDTLAWKNTNPPERRAIEESTIDINEFLNINSKWVIEGCYTDLLSVATKEASKIIFLNPGIETCINNCKKRPWEPHKYASIEEQNKYLEMLIT